MGPEVISGFLWLARTTLRCGQKPVKAGHGYADAAFRPADLPFVSVLGPMAVELNAERETQKAPVVLLQMPGYVMGAPLETNDAIPAGGALRLRFDGRGIASLDDLPAVALGDPSSCGAFAAAVELRIRDAVTAGAIQNESGAPLLDAADLADIAAATCRFDQTSRRFAIASGRRGVAQGIRVSSVEVLPTPGDIATQLGLRDGSTVPGRLLRHERPPPRAINMGVRLDLWAASQLELASLADHLVHVVPSRGAVRTLPALLARSGADGEESLALMSTGEPTTLHSLVHVEAGGGPVDRVTGRAFVPAITPSPATGRFVLENAQPSMQVGVWPSPLVPSPLDSAHPAPRGLALGIGVALGPAGATGDEVQACALLHEDEPVLRVMLQRAKQGPLDVVDVRATATFVQKGGAKSTATTLMRLELEELSKGILLHAVVVAAKGLVELHVNGEAQPLGDPAKTPVLPVPAAGKLAAGPDMTLVLGSPGGSPLSLHVGYAHLFSEPFGPFDPALRTSTASAQRFMSGQRIQLVRRGDRAEERASFTVLAVDRDVLEISPPLRGAWPAGQTAVFAEEHFFEQVSLKRRDDLANHLFRLSGEYRVSAFLDQQVVEPPVPVVAMPEVDVAARVTSVGPAVNSGGVPPHGA